MDLKLAYTELSAALTEHFVELFKELQQENGGRAPTAKQLAQTCDISMDTAKEILAELKEIVPPPPKRARKVAEKKPESAESLAEKPVQEETQEPAGKPSSGTPAEAKSPMAVETPTPPSAVVAVDEETQLDAFEQHVEQLFTEPTAGQRMKQYLWKTRMWFHHRSHVLHCHQLLRCFPRSPTGKANCLL